MGGKQPSSWTAGWRERHDEGFNGRLHSLISTTIVISPFRPHALPKYVGLSRCGVDSVQRVGSKSRLSLRVEGLFRQPQELHLVPRQPIQQPTLANMSEYEEEPRSSLPSPLRSRPSGNL